jgi:putative chitinase
MNITEDQLAAMLPTNKEIAEWCKVLNSALPKYDINNARRIAAFISQCAHESRDFTALEENLNYSQQALERVFSRYFGAGKRNAAEYARNPEKDCELCLYGRVPQQGWRARQYAAGGWLEIPGQRSQAIDRA